MQEVAFSYSNFNINDNIVGKYLNHQASYIVTIRPPASGIFCKDFEAIACVRYGGAGLKTGLKSDVGCHISMVPGFSYVISYDDSVGLRYRVQ